MEENLHKILDKSYELVGLIELSISRKGEMPNLKNLLKGKVEELMGQIERLPVSDSAVVSNFSVDSDTDEGFIYGDVDELNQSDGSCYSDESVKSNHPIISYMPDRLDHRKLRFALNDKFLFIRGLFGGSSSQFEKVVAELSDMRDFESAKKYLAPFRWKKDDDAVMRFLEIIRRHVEGNSKQETVNM